MEKPVGPIEWKISDFLKILALYCAIVLLTSGFVIYEVMDEQRGEWLAHEKFCTDIGENLDKTPWEAFCADVGS